MKIKKYEKYSLVISMCIIIFIIEVIFTFLLITTKEYKYKKINGVVVKDNLVDIVIPSKEKNIIYKNKYLYLNDKKIKFKIVEEKKNVYKHNKEKYHELLVSYKFDKKYKTSDILSISIKKEKYRLIEIFKLIWEGD